MSLVDYGITEVPPAQSTYGAYITLDATGERAGSILQIYKAGNIRNIWFRPTTVTEEDTLKISLQGVDANGLPDGTILATATGNKAYTTATFADTDDNTWLGPYALTEDAAVTRGQNISIVFEWNSYADGNLQLSTQYLQNIPYNFYSVTDVAASPGTWVKNSTACVCAILEYDDGTYAFPTTIYNGLLTVTTATTPDEIGNYFQLPFSCRAVGFAVFGEFDYDFTAALLNTSNTVLANATVSATQRIGTSTGLHYIFFDGDPASSVTIAKNTYYRMILTPATASTAYMRLLSAPEAAALQALPLGGDCIYTSRTDGGAWSQDDTKRANISLLVDQIPSVTDIPSVGNVTTDDTVDGATGTFASPAEADVKVDVQYGAGGTEFTGTYAPAGGSGGSYGY